MKKLTAGIFTVLMGLVSVNAADAAVASKGYVDAKAAAVVNDYKTTNDQRVQAVEDEVDTLQGQVGDASTGLIKDVADLETAVENLQGGELTIKAEAITTDKLAPDAVTNAKLADNAVQTENIVDGNVTEAKLNADLASKINGKVDQTTYDNKVEALEKADTDNLAEAKSYADSLAPNYDAAGTASGLIGGLNVTDTAVAGEYVSAVSEAGGKISVTRAALPTVDQSVIDNSTNAVSGEGVKTYVDAAISDSATEVNQGIEANTQAIAAINNESTGILAQAKADAEAKANAAESNAKTYADGLKTAIDNAYAAADATALQSAKDYADGLAGNYDVAGAASDALDTAKTYAVGKANEALTASVKYTDDYITALGLQDISRVPAACSNENAYCTLTTNGSGFAWEVIARAEGETPAPTATNVGAVTKPLSPAALTE